MKQMARILYIHNIRSTFVEIDETLLRERYEVKSAYIQRFTPGLFWEMWRQTRDIDVVVAWFASWHSFPGFLAARLRGIPRLLITGGYDVANEPETGYGLRQGGLPYMISDAVFRLTSLALPFSETSYRETLTNTPLTPERTRMIPLGVPDHPAFEKPVSKEPIVLTVIRLSKTNATRKSIVEYLQAARLLPDIPFVVVGKAYDDYINYLKQIAPSNVEFTGYLSDDDLADLRCRAKVYVQASHHEGFGLALAESMLARCVPVVSRRGSLPEVVGDAGIYLETIAPQPLADSIRQALGAEPSLGERARLRILQRFPVEKRARELGLEIDRLLNSTRGA